jgi:hypothetical protein
MRPTNRGTKPHNETYEQGHQASLGTLRRVKLSLRLSRIHGNSGLQRIKLCAPLTTKLMKHLGLPSRSTSLSSPSMRRRSSTVINVLWMKQPKRPRRHCHLFQRLPPPSSSVRPTCKLGLTMSQHTQCRAEMAE